MTQNLKEKFDAVLEAAKALPGYSNWPHEERRRFLSSNLKMRGLTVEALKAGGEDFLHYCDVEFESFVLNRRFGE